MTRPPTFAPKVPLGWILELYRHDAAGRPDDEAAQKVGSRIWSRCRDLLLVADGLVRCPDCETEFAVHWIDRQPETASSCPTCSWAATAAEYQRWIEHRDLIGGRAAPEIAAFVSQFPQASSYAERMRLIDALVHAVHRTGGRVARNIIEGRATEVVRALDAFKGS